MQSVTGALSESKPGNYFGITDVKARYTLYLLVEPQTCKSQLGIMLLDFGGKPLSMAVQDHVDEPIMLEYKFLEHSSDYSLRLFGCHGEYHLSAGLNAPEVLSRQMEDSGVSVLRSAIPVTVGLRLQQITGVDQKAENFSVVATLKMDWYDPRLAFSPEECNCLTKVFNQKNFNDFIRDKGDSWPDFTFFNQQGNRWIQNQELVILPDGHATYLEHFTTTFQAPDFNFRQFPFDTQQFYIRMDGIWSEELYYFQDNEPFTELGAQLGEEEWYTTDFGVTVSSEESSTEILTP